ncbi:hypothetical protein KZ850_27415, partial [Pseudomonas aeruginosa]|nr:hypothetical protein [Pseudomonas aeruginosa]
MPEHAPILPVIAAEVAALAPGFRALSLTVEAAPIVRPEIADRAAVSYTHLRAHETLANLVCR